MTKNVIFIDIDGTLTNKLGKIPNTAIDAINIARRNGHKIFLCTGRSKIECSPILDKVSVDGIVGNGGSYVEVNNKIIHDVSFSVTEVKKVTSYLDSKNVSFYLSSEKAIYSNKILKRKIKKIKFLIPKRYKEKFREFPPIDELSKEKIYKVNFINHKIPYVDILNDLYGDYSISPSTIAALGKNSGELMPPHTSKAQGIEKAIQELNIQKKHTIGIGNGINDISLFQGVETKVAVEDAAAELKEKADIITDRPMKNGIYNAFRLMNLI
ncbi:Cof-type HAD-IIB family hydrolase [Enterococcus casseliflavus]|uniref:Cof-type HAD-IIB family hydrolase n=1 Tax=Enterococcus casseliflavus TaxID=37734 RepID=UPI0039A6FA86